MASKQQKERNQNIRVFVRVRCIAVFTHGPQGSRPRAANFQGRHIKKKSRLKYGMRLNHLAILAIENDLTVKLDFENVISVFASTKARRSFS